MKLSDMFEAQEASINIEKASAIDLANFVVAASVQIAIRNVKRDDDEPMTKEDLRDQVNSQASSIIDAVKDKLDEIAYGSTKLDQLIKKHLPDA